MTSCYHTQEILGGVKFGRLYWQGKNWQISYSQCICKMHFRCIWEYWQFWQIAYDLSIFPLPKFSCVRYHKPCHYPQHCCVSSKGVLPYSLFAGHCRLSPIQVGSETGIQCNFKGSPDGKCAFTNGVHLREVKGAGPAKETCYAYSQKHSV